MQNFLFLGADSGGERAAIYSLIGTAKTAKANGAETFAYLSFLFERLPHLHLKRVEDFEAVLPWAADLPARH
jgi:hypothetical protein